MKSFQNTFFVVLLFAGGISAQVSFQIAFNFPQPPGYTLTNIQLFDYNSDGCNDVVAGFRNDIDWSVLVIDTSGSIMAEFQGSPNSGEWLHQILVFRQDSLICLAVGFKKYPEAVMLKIYDFVNFTLLSQIQDGSFPYSGWYFNDVDIVNLSLVKENNLSLLNLGYIVDSITDDLMDYHIYSESALSIFLFEVTNFPTVSLSHVATVGKYHQVCPFSKLAIGFKSDHGSGGGFSGQHMDYWFAIADYSAPAPDFILKHHLSGNWYEDINLNIIYNHYPTALSVLTTCDSTYLNYGTVIYYQETHTVQGSTSTIQKFAGRSPDFSTGLWLRDDTNLALSGGIDASANIGTTIGDHYIIYFKDSMFEVRDRISGAPVYHQSASIAPFFIASTSSNELYFFSKNNGIYEVYTLSSEIVLSTEAEPNLAFPSHFRLHQNYPNPFNPSTTIRYTLPKSELVILKVYDILGREVATLVNERQTVGNYSIQFNASQFSSGLYFYKIIAESFSKTRKMVLLR